MGASPATDRRPAGLTENGITRWLANHIGKLALVDFDDERVRTVLKEEEPRKNYLFLPRASSVDEVTSEFAHRPLLEGVLITHYGKSSERLLGMVTRWDRYPQGGRSRIVTARPFAACIQPSAWHLRLEIAFICRSKSFPGTSGHHLGGYPGILEQSRDRRRRAVQACAGRVYFHSPCLAAAADTWAGPAQRNSPCIFSTVA